MRICYFGTYRADYSRNQIMIEGLRCSGVDVIECHETLWHGIEDRVQAVSGGWLNSRFIWRAVRTYIRLLRAYAQVGDYDVMVLGYPGQLDVFGARLLTWLRRKPLVLDLFMSIYLIALERGLDTKSRASVRLVRLLEAVGGRLPDLLISDTPEYVTWYAETHRLPPHRFRLVPTGADDRVFKPILSQPVQDGLFRVMYYGTYIPNHGVDTIVEAAHLLQNYAEIHFLLIGAGPTKALALELAQRYRLGNITFVPWLPQAALVSEVARADLVLGAFGTTLQSCMTVQNKIYESLAMAKPVITGDSPTVRQALQHGVHAYLVERANPAALAAGILALRDDPALRQSLAVQGRALFEACYTTRQLGARFRRHLQEVLAAQKNDR